MISSICDRVIPANNDSTVKREAKDIKRQRPISERRNVCHGESLAWGSWRWLPQARRVYRVHLEGLCIYATVSDVLEVSQIRGNMVSIQKSHVVAKKIINQLQSPHEQGKNELEPSSYACGHMPSVVTRKRVGQNQYY